MNDLILSQMRQRLEILYQMVDELERGGGGGGGSDDSYTKAQTDTLLSYKADKSTTYTKSQTDNLLSAKANKSTTYTKTEVDTALAEKANASTTYTKTEVNTALAAKADKTNTYTKTQTDNLLNLKANTSYVNTVKDTADTANTLAVDNRAALVEFVDEGAKNALNHTAYTRTVNGVNYTVNNDRTITATSNGTNTQSLLYLVQNYTGLPAGRYVLSGCSGGSSTTYDLRVKVGNTTYINYDGGTEFTYNGTDSFEASIVVRANKTLNITFKPMVCLKALWDISQEYQPYRPNYQTLCDTNEYITGTGTELASNANLNDYNYVCKMYSPSGTVSATLVNTPWTTSGFQLITIQFMTPSSYIQFLIPNTTSGKWYRRRYTSGAWGNWIEYDGTVMA